MQQAMQQIGIGHAQNMEKVFLILQLDKKLSSGVGQPRRSADRLEPAGPVLRCPHNFWVQ